MNFDQLVGVILNESTISENSAIQPKLDGKREIYTTYISTRDSIGYTSSMYDLYRMRANEQFSEWDDTSIINKMFYEGCDFNKAYTVWQTVLYNTKSLASKEEIVSRLLREARKTIDLIGNFRVFHAADDYVFGVEIDVLRYKMGGLISIANNATTDEEGSIMNL